MNYLVMFVIAEKLDDLFKPKQEKPLALSLCD